MRGSDFADLKAFAAIVEFRSFSAAARSLGVSPSALSQRMRELEERLGARLLNRTTRSVSPTDNGARLLDTLIPLFAGLDHAVAEVEASEQTARGTLRINVPRVAAIHLVAPILELFHRAHPLINLDLTIDDGLTDIVAGRFDAGIRLGDTIEKDMVAIKLGGQRRAMVVASPRLTDRIGVPESPHDLHRFPCIRFRWPSAQGLYRWEFERLGETIEVAVEGPLIANDTGMMLEAAVRGLGFAYVLDIEAESLVRSGALREVLRDWMSPFPGFYLYHSSNRHITRHLQIFVEYLKAHTKENIRNVPPKTVGDE